MRLVARRARGTKEWTHYFHVPEEAWDSFNQKIRTEPDNEYAEVRGQYKIINPENEKGGSRPPVTSP